MYRALVRIALSSLIDKAQPIEDFCLDPIIPILAFLSMHQLPPRFRGNVLTVSASIFAWISSRGIDLKGTSSSRIRS